MTVRQWFACLGAALLVFGLLTGCTTGHEENTGEITANPADAVFREDGSTDFVIVRGDQDSGTGMRAAMTLRKQMKETLGFDIRLGTDFIKEGNAEYSENEFEILVGGTNREASAMFDGDRLRAGDWAVGRQGGKIVLAGTDALEDAVSYVLSTLCIDGNLYIPDGYRYLSRGTYAHDGLTVGGNDIADMTVIHDGTAEAKHAAEAFADYLLETFGYRLPVLTAAQAKNSTGGAVRFLACGSGEVGRNVLYVRSGDLYVTCGMFATLDESLELLKNCLSDSGEASPVLPEGFRLTKEAERRAVYTVRADAVGGGAYEHKTGDTMEFSLTLHNGGDPVPGCGFSWVLTSGSGETAEGTSDTSENVRVSYTFRQPEYVWLTVRVTDPDGNPAEDIPPVTVGGGADLSEITAGTPSGIPSESERVGKKQTDEAARAALLGQRRTDIAGSAADPTTHIYRLADSGLMVRYADFKAKKPGDRLELLQISDLHLNRISDRDREEALPCIESTRENRSWCRNEASAPNARNAMAAARCFDQTVITGDNIDYLTWGSLDLLKETVWDTDPDAIVALGGHDTTRVMQGQTADPSTYASRLEILQSAWPHDILYSSRILDDRVMVIQMDNGNTGYSAEQAARLVRDLQTCRDEQLIAFLFQHEPICTGNPADTDVTPIRINDGSGSHDFFGQFRGSAAMPDPSGVYRLITSSADVIKGIFCGHMHCDYYTEIQASSCENGTPEPAVIPQYVLTGSPYDSGHILIIGVES